MLKKLVKLVSLVQAVRHGHAYGRTAYKPWKGKKRWKGYGYGPYDARGYHRPSGYGYGPHGHGRPRGLKGLILEAILRRLLKHR
jgi:hypothetical protein